MSLLRDLRITDLAHNGAGVGSAAAGRGSRGKTVFVQGALPGQTVTCRVIADKKNWLAAELVAVTDEESMLAEPICSHGHECGGCPWQRLPYERQLFFRQRLARETLGRIGAISPDILENAWLPVMPSPLLRNFRNKIELAFGRDREGKPCLGFRSRQSHVVVPVSDCALLNEKAGALVAAANLFADIHPDHDFRHLVLRRCRTLADPELAWHCLLITGPACRAHARSLAERLLEAGAASFVHEERKRPDQLARGERRILCLDGQGTAKKSLRLALELGGRLFEFDPASFFQVNDGAASQLVGEVASLGRESGPLLDLYCGVGAPAQLRSDRHDACLGIELDRNACAMAADNARRHGLAGWKYKAVPTAKLLANLANEKGFWPTVLLDPPRQGIGRDGIASLLTLGPAELIYVSCDPATLARDAKLLGQDFELASIRPVDMFPHTPHLECVSYWVRKRVV